MDEYVPASYGGFTEGDEVVVRGEYSFSGKTTEEDGAPFRLRPIPGARGLITEFEGDTIAIVQYADEDWICDGTSSDESGIILTDLRCLQTVDFPQLADREEVERWLTT